MFKINLVPEVQEKKNQIKKMNATSVVIATVIMGISVVSLVLLGLASATLGFQITNTDKKIADIKKESEQYKSLEDAVISLEKGLAGIKEIYSGKNQWGTLLAHLESATPGNVKYKSLKLSAGAAEAQIEATNIEGFSKLIQSYKRYQVITVSGTGEAGQVLTTRLDGSDTGTVTVNQAGAWKTAFRVDLNKDHEMKVGNGEKFATISYVAEKQKLEGTDGATGVINNLFTNVETKEYQKQNGKITATVKFGYNGGALW